MQLLGSTDNATKTSAYWINASRHPEDKRFYYDVENKENLVDTNKSKLYDEDENVNCITVEKNENKEQDHTFAFRSSQCKENVAYPICMIVKDESENETTTVSSTTISSATDSPSVNDSSSNLLPTIDWSQVPCPSEISRKKRASGKKASEKEKEVIQDQETTTQAANTPEQVYYIKGM